MIPLTNIEHRHFNYPSRFWKVYVVDASTLGTIQSSLEGIARTASAGTTAQDALMWLAGQQHDWLLLFDNADDPDINLRQFFPTCKHGNIIVTSRNPACRIYAPDSHFNVSGMNPDDAVELLLKMSTAQRSPANLERAALICRELGYLALAIAQAGAYIGHSCSLDDYLHIYWEDRAQLLQKHSPQSPDDYQWTVYTTWEISLKKLTPIAMMFLRICSFMHHGGISRAIFQSAAVADLPGESFQDAKQFLNNFKSQIGEWNTLAFLDHTNQLLSYSLINLDTESQTYTIHPLVHAWARDRATAEERAEARMCALQIQALAVGDGKLETAESLSLRRSLLPHVDVCRTADLQPDIAAQLHYVYIATGRWNAAEDLLTLVLDARQALLGDGHQDTVCVMVQLVRTYYEQGRWKEAEKLGLQVMEVAWKVLGEEHPDTLENMANLANGYCRQGRLKKAEELQLRVMEVTRRVLGDEHPHTLVSMGNLATTYDEQGRRKEAEELTLRVMEVMRRVLGEEHPHTLMIMGNLAHTYCKHGRWQEAEELTLRVMEMRRRVLGEEHPNTLVSMGNLANTCHQQGRLKEAEELHLQAMEVRRRVLGEEHPDTLISMGNLANIYSEQGRLKEAEELELRVIEVRRRVLGEEHPNTVIGMGNLAHTYHEQGRLKEAEELEVRVLDVTRRVLGEEHPGTLLSIGNLASTYCEQGRLKEAEELQLQVMVVMRQVLGEEHRHTLTTMRNLANTYFHQGRRNEAEQLALQVLEKLNKVLGDNHPDTLATATWVACRFGSASSSQDSQAAVSRAKLLRVPRWLRRVVMRR